MTYFSKYDYTIIRKHWIILFFRYLKFFLFLFISVFLYFICLKLKWTIWHELLYYVFFPLIFFLINYIFIKLILWYIKFYNDLLIIHKWQLIVIKSSLFFKDNIEFIDINKVTKLDTFCTWFVSNLIWYWNLVVEQQRDEVRKFHFIPNPFKALQLLKDEKQRTIDERKNTYIHNV